MDQRNTGRVGDYFSSRAYIGDSYHGHISGGISGGQSNNNTVNNFWDAPDSVFKFLAPHIVQDAFYNSRKREEEHTSTCHPDTHTRIIRNLQNWTRLRSANSSVCWLRGPAGTGKSTIAHTIAEKCDQKGKLAATFFFSRGKGDREDINKLVPSLAYQIATNVPQLQAQIQRVLREDPTILSRQLGKQFSKLIVEPFSLIERPDTFLIIIDGLDECSAKEAPAHKSTQTQHSLYIPIIFAQ